MKIKEQKLLFENGSVCYIPRVKTGNAGLDKAINGKIKEQIPVFKDDDVLNMGYSAFQNGDMLSVFFEGEVQNDSFFKSLHINLKNARAYSLKDLILEERLPDFEALVNEELSINLGQYAIVYKPDVFSAAFDIADNQLIIIFAPGAVAPYDMGFVDAAFDLFDIDELINKNGEMYLVISEFD
ncbi:MAG: hypothetical protein IJR47_02420 [Clostridia bacterium]|nr:hypothetical protein [Clostridia bacterium]